MAKFRIAFQLIYKIYVYVYVYITVLYTDRLCPSVEGLCGGGGLKRDVFDDISTTATNQKLIF